VDPARKARFGHANLDAAAVEAYLYGFPLLIMSAAARHATDAVGFNRFLHRFDLAETWMRGILLPNRDLVFSIAWLDLRVAPVILTSLQTDSYYVMSLIDAWTNVFATLGTRATGNAERRYLISGPQWTGAVPASCTHIESPTNLACIVAQTSFDGISLGTHDLASLDDRYHLEALGDAALHLERASVLRDVDGLCAGEAFTRIRSFMLDNPPARADAGAVDALEALDGYEEDDAVARAVAQARGMIDEMPTGDEPGGWSISSDAGNFGTDYLRRARAARYDFLACTVEDVLCAQTRVDSQREPLRGDRQYVLHFDPWDEPPARAFWSLCALDDERRIMGNGSGRRVLDSRQMLTRRPNRSLDLYVTRDAPDDMRNWLPSPSGAFTLALRLYWPSPAALSGVWTPPAVAVL
jgi:hypothetical protein